MAESQDKKDKLENDQPDQERSRANSQTITGDPGHKTEDVKETMAKQGPPSDVEELCRETFLKTAEYLRGELDGTIEDYKLLEKMNKLTMNRYSEMKHIALSISGALKDLNEKYKSLQPYLEQIDQIEESVASLEQAAYSLDHYSKRLESKFKALERR